MAQQSRKPARSKPITEHQLFPAVVALWFGALFGLGSLAVRPSLLEDIVMRSRVDLLVPAAAPPLGLTARILVALGLATLGALIGIVVARRLAQPRREVRERRRGAGPHGEDLSQRAGREMSGRSAPPAAQPAEEADDGGQVRRRRTLAVAEDEVRFVPHETVPLPGGSPQVLNIGEIALDRTAGEPASETAAAVPITQSAEDLNHEAAAAAAAGRQVFGLQPPPAEETWQIFGQVPGNPGSVFDPPQAVPLFAQPVDTGPAAPQAPAFAPPAQTAADLPAGPVAAPVQPAEPQAEPAMIDLAARLAESMARRRAERAARAAAQAEPAEPKPVPAAVPPAAFAPLPVEAMQVPAREPAASPNPAPLPLALRPLDLDGFEEGDGDELESLLPPRRMAMPTARTETPTPSLAPEPVDGPAQDDPADPAADETAEENYASLIGLVASPARPGFVRVDEPEAAEGIEPVVIFPGQSGPLPVRADDAVAPFRRFDAPTSAEPGQPVSAEGSGPSMNADEAQLALRSALANLQRISGAA